MRSVEHIRRAAIAAALALTPLHAGAGIASPMGPADSDQPDELLLVDRLIVRSPLSSRVQGQLVPAHSMESVIEVFRRNGVKFERDDARLPIRLLPPDLVKAIGALRPGEPFVVPTDADRKGWMVGVVQGRVPAE